MLHAFTWSTVTLDSPQGEEGTLADYDDEALVAEALESDSMYTFVGVQTLDLFWLPLIKPIEWTLAAWFTVNGPAAEPVLA